MKILVVDIGGHHVKLLASGESEPRAFVSGGRLSPQQMVRGTLDASRDWRYEVVSIGYPGPVLHGRPVREPHNLGRGWVGFDYEAALGRPVKLVNDAAMQAIGSYEGGTMLFLGLGTGLGSALMVDGRVEAMELAHLPYRKGRSYEDYVGERGLQRLGTKKWRKAVIDVVETLRAALRPDYVVLGGGNARKLDAQALPAQVRLGDNANAFVGGFRLWADAAHAPRCGLRTRSRGESRARSRTDADSKS
jgi:polyphosphate glucokinase